MKNMGVLHRRELRLSCPELCYVARDCQSLDLTSCLFDFKILLVPLHPLSWWRVQRSFSATRSVYSIYSVFHQMHRPVHPGQTCIWLHCLLFFTHLFLTLLQTYWVLGFFFFLSQASSGFMKRNRVVHSQDGGSRQARRRTNAEHRVF